MKREKNNFLFLSLEKETRLPKRVADGMNNSGTLCIPGYGGAKGASILSLVGGAASRWSSISGPHPRDGMVRTQRRVGSGQVGSSRLSFIKSRPRPDTRLPIYHCRRFASYGIPLQANARSRSHVRSRVSFSLRASERFSRLRRPPPPPQLRLCISFAPSFARLL